LSGEIVKHCKTPLTYDANLLLDGLLALYHKNHKA